MMSVKQFYCMGFVLALTAKLTVAPSSAAEIVCIDPYGPGATQIDAARLAAVYPSGRRPTPDTCRKVLIKGTIVSGDAAKFAQIVHRSHPFLDSVLLWSSGGSVEEAMKIGRLIRNGLLTTEAPSDLGDKPIGRGWFFATTLIPGCPEYNRGTAPKGRGCHCASACFLIWSAGVERSGDSLGLHRPTTASTGFANLPPNRASVLYRQLLLDIGKYLTDMEIQRRFVEVMMDTTSTEIRWLNSEEAALIEEVPSIAEWLGVTCGRMTKSERDTMLRIAVEMDQLKRNVSERDRMLREQLEKRTSEINLCGARKLWTARDAISQMSDR